MGVIGVGVMGTAHARYIESGDIKRCELTAVCDLRESQMDGFSGARHFTDSRELIRYGEVDAVLIVTPHYSHTTIGIDALQNGLHVLTEKPISVHKADAVRLIAAHTNEKQVFGAMFQLRTIPCYKKIKQLIESGELGELYRVTWIITEWFRTEAYYAMGGWRGTWEGEGGGVLLNQCPHNLDLLQWFCGMPSKVRAFCGFGVKHKVEVEDQVTAYLEYPNGSTGVFITTTGEAPGTNRLEIAGEAGKLVLENGKLQFTRNEIPMTEFSRTTSHAFAKPEVWNIDIPAGSEGGLHREVTQLFVDAVLDGTPPLVRAEEGLNSVELANAMVYSTLTSSTVEMPLDGAAFEESLVGLMGMSTFNKASATDAVADLSKSFTK
jgi:predicted dehydrogenase